DDLSSDEESQKGNVANKADKNESGFDRVSESSFMHETTLLTKMSTFAKKESDELKFPHCFTLDNNDQEKNVGENIKDTTERVQSLSNKLNDCCSNRGFSSQRSMNSHSQKGTWAPTLSKLLIISVYAPQDLNERRDLWDYLHTFIDRWEGDTVIMGDFNEAFDSVKWDYLEETIKAFGFGSKWSNWISSCLNNAMGLVLVNSSPTLEFQFHKGLKQGLKINLHKSKLMGIGVSSNVVAAAASLIGCSILIAPFSYLGVNKVVEQMELAISKKRRLFSVDEEEELLESDDRQKRTDTFFSKKKKVQSTLNKIYKKDKRDKVCQQIDWFFYTSDISFNCVKNLKFKKMIQMVCDFGRGLDPPSYYEMRVTYLKKVVDYTKALLEDYKKEWKKTGCTLMSDGWSDQKNRSICNFLVNSPKGTIFLASVDTSEISKIKEKVFALLDDFVEKIGEEHTSSNFSKLEIGKNIESIVLDALGFWGSVSTCRLAVIPLIKVLRMVDLDFTPAMGFIYQAMKKAKEEIKSNYKSVQSRYEPIINIIDAIWDNQLNRPLHVAGYFLNPRMQYSPDFKGDIPYLKLNLYMCIKKCVDSFGDDTPELKRFAMRVLSLMCSSSGCERNWSAFEMKINDLVYVMYNLKLIGREQKKMKETEAAIEQLEALDFEDVESDDEWITEEESTQSQAHDGGGDNVFLESAIMSQFGEVASKVLYKRLYALEMCKSISVAEKMGHPSLSHSFRRMPRGGMEQENYDLLCSKVADLVLPNISYRGCCSLEGSQEFSVKSSRILIDNTILSKAEVPTRWLRVVPIKVNIHAWRVFLDKLATRANLSLRGMDIPSIACLLCNSAVESSSYIFFACPLARQVWRNFLIWWELKDVAFNSYNEWLN
nr:zf-BED domain-containing protein [Tanacetum cinerariifolium]